MSATTYMQYATIYTINQGLRVAVDVKNQINLLSFLPAFLRTKPH